MWKNKGRIVLTYFSRFRTPQGTHTTSKPPNRQTESQSRFLLLIPLHFKFGHRAKRWASNKIEKSVHQFVPRDYHPIRKEQTARLLLLLASKRISSCVSTELWLPDFSVITGVQRIISDINELFPQSNSHVNGRCNKGKLQRHSMDLFLEIYVLQANLLAGRFGKNNISFGRKVLLGNRQCMVSEGILCMHEGNPSPNPNLE